MTKAMPLPAGTCPRNCSKASSPPAEAPMPTMGNDTPACENGVSAEAVLAGFLRRRFDAGFLFMILFPALILIMLSLAPAQWLCDTGSISVCS